MDKRLLLALIILGLALLFALAFWLASFAKPAACRDSTWSIPALLNCHPAEVEPRHG